MKNFANAEIEVVKFDNAVIATSGCTGATSAENYAQIYQYYINSPLYMLSKVTFEQYLVQSYLGYSTETNLITKTM